jgi:hypothetical protein
MFAFLEGGMTALRSGIGWFGYAKPRLGMAASGLEITKATRPL